MGEPEEWQGVKVDFDYDNFKGSEDEYVDYWLGNILSAGACLINGRSSS